MTDFASVAMMKLIHRGLKQQGIALPSPAPTRGAHVALTDKRAVLVGLAEKFGLDAVLRIGDAVHSVEADPALTALTMAHDAIDLLSRWQQRVGIASARRQPRACKEGLRRVFTQ